MPDDVTITIPLAVVVEAMRAAVVRAFGRDARFADDPAVGTEACRRAVAEVIAGLDTRGEIRAMAEELARTRLREHMIEAVDVALRELARERVKALRRQGTLLPAEPTP